MSIQFSVFFEANFASICKKFFNLLQTFKRFEPKNLLDIFVMMIECDITEINQQKIFTPNFEHTRKFVQSKIH